MRRTHHLSAQSRCAISFCVCFALLFSAAGIPLRSASSKESTRVRPQEQPGNERRVTPVAPRTGPPAPNLPNLDEVKHRQVPAPRAANALPSMLRSRRKPLESRNGRRVGDRLPPITRPTPQPTPSALPIPVPTPRHDELARFESPSRYLGNDLVFRYLLVPFLSRGFLTPLSDSSTPLFASGNLSFDVAPAPIPQAGGSKIVFASSRDGFMQIYVMNSDGTGQARLTTDGSNNENPRWSPDGTKILFQSDRDNPGTGLRDIYVMNSNGSGQTRLTYDTNDDCNASWSSDATKIVFQSLRNAVNYQIYTMNADGSGQANVSNNGVNDVQPSWSPDGTKIAFASERDQTGFPSVYVMNANGANQTRLTFSGVGLRDEQPVWSPNGSKIAFTSTRDSTTDSWTETDDYEIPEDDGQTFPKSRLNINKEVYVMNTDGSGQMRLTNDLSNDDSPTWSPDGVKIVFRSERERDLFDATPQLWTMNADGSGQTNLSNSGDSDFSPSWTSGSANQPPVAVAGGPYSGVVSQNAPFSGSGSYDPDGTIISYSWTFGDGGTGSGVAPYHAYATTGTFTVTLSVTDNLGAQASGSTTINISASSSDQYVTSFLQWALGRPPNAEETTYWTDIFRAAYPKGLSSMKLATRELGMTVFESAEYAARNRNDHWYVYDLYKTFLMREPDVEGWAHWEAAIPIYGRDQIRRGFDESTEFANIVATLTASGSPSANVSSLATARVDPFNQSGNQLQARDAEWSANLLSLPGRAGLDLGLGISYSSLVFTRSGPYSYFDADNGSPSPGFHIGFPTIQDKYFDAQVGANVYLLKTSAGRKSELRQVGTSNVYESADSSYLQLIYSGNLLLRTTDGTQMTFGWTGLNEYRCFEIKDRNGNYIAVSYDWRGDIQNVTDTLGRVITFNYDANANLSSITQTWNGQAHTWATFGWDNLTMQPSVTGIVGTYNGEVVPVLKMVGFHDATYVKFFYNGNGQLRQITQYGSDSNPLSDNHPRNYTIFDYDSASNDCPRLNATRTWAEYWTGFNGVPNEVTKQFGVEGDKRTVTVLGDPNATVYKEAYAGSSAPAWQRGLVLGTEVWAGSTQQKLTTVSWTQDNPNVNYKTNPRVIESNVYDSVGNRRRVTIDYSVAAYAQYGLPYFVREYAADATTILRETYTDYNLSQPYLDHRIIGLVAAVHLVSGGYQAKITYGYDDPSRLTSQATNATMHDQYYNSSFTVRGNVTSVSRWDVTDITNASKALTNSMTYNSAGSVVAATDPATHTSTIGYADWFSDGNNGRNTLAYPTTLTDADGFSSTVQYNFDFGAKTRVEGPPPENQPNGVIQTFLYDSAARLERVTTLNNGAYTRYIYGPTYVASLATVNNHLDEAYSIQYFDGLGRATNAAGNHPGSTGGYKAQLTMYDLMGRAVQQTNPTEITGSWVPSGDDLAGWQWNNATEYDWQGRATKTYNMDGTYKTAAFSGCGCAGGEVVTVTDEVGRRQKVYSDVLGRQWKTEVLNWDGTVYSTIRNTFNPRDQVTLVRQFAGTDQSSTYQDTTMNYDGHGRLQMKHVPEQNAGTATVYAYNPDDTIQSVTDARGASATYGYNNRHLVSSISYAAPSGVTPTANITLEYDAAGNRRLMTDGSGSTNYSYDSLSRLQSETRTFNGLAGSYSLAYGYNLANEVTTVTDPTNASIYYSHNTSGRVTSVTGSPYGTGGQWGVPYMEISQYATSLQYRASGAAKSFTYGNGLTFSLTYDSRLRPSEFEIAGRPAQFGPPTVMKSQFQYSADSNLKYARDYLDERFDRAFSFDHVGGLKEGYSGSEARDHVNGTSSGPPTGPFRQSYQHDQFGNMTSRTNRFWSRNDEFVASYVNNRRHDPAFQYDVDGNLIQDADLQYAYDAAGRNASIFSASDNKTITPAYDGAGQTVRRAETENGFTNTTYYVWSSVLGKVLTELNASGAKLKTYIYLGGQVLACQQPNWVHWQHDNPITGSRGSSGREGAYGGEMEPDPMGVDVGFYDPFIQPIEPPPSETAVAPMLIGDQSGCGANPNCTRCSLDGFQIDCADAFHMVGVGSAIVAPVNTVVGIYSNTLQRYVGLAVWNQTAAANGIALFGQGSLGFLPSGSSINQVDGRGSAIVFPGWFTSLSVYPYGPQNFLSMQSAGILSAVGAAVGGYAINSPPQQSRLRPGRAWAFNDEQKKIIDAVNDRINRKDCRDFINGLLAENRVASDRNTLDKLLQVADLNTYNHEADLTNTDLGVSMDALIELRNAFMNPPHAPAATADNRHIFLVERAFQRKFTDVLPSIGVRNRNLDTATFIVHELLHVAGLNDPQVDSLNQRIHENCGFKGMDY